MKKYNQVQIEKFYNEAIMESTGKDPDATLDYDSVEQAEIIILKNVASYTSRMGEEEIGNVKLVNKGDGWFLGSIKQ